jgi:hypothetical protein
MGTTPLSLCFVHRELKLDGTGGGVSTYHGIVAGILAQAGHEVTILALDEGHKDGVPVGVRVIWLRNSQLKTRIWGLRSLTPSVNWLVHNVRVAVALRRIQNGGRLDIVETPDNAAECLFFSFFRKNSKLVVRPQYPDRKSVV